MAATIASSAGTGSDSPQADAGDDAIVWNNGDGSDPVNEGGAGFDRVEVNGSAAAGDGSGIRRRRRLEASFVRTNLVGFTLEIAPDNEVLAFNGVGGNDTFKVTDEGSAMTVAADGGAGNDELSGAGEVDSFFGGSGDDADRRRWKRPPRRPGRRRPDVGPGRDRRPGPWRCRQRQRPDRPGHGRRRRRRRGARATPAPAPTPGPPPVVPPKPQRSGDTTALLQGRQVRGDPHLMASSSPARRSHARWQRREGAARPSPWRRRRPSSWAGSARCWCSDRRRSTSAPGRGGPCRSESTAVPPASPGTASSRPGPGLELRRRRQLGGGTVDVGLRFPVARHDATPRRRPRRTRGLLPSLTQVDSLAPVAARRPDPRSQQPGGSHRSTLPSRLGPVGLPRRRRGSCAGDVCAGPCEAAPVRNENDIGYLLSVLRNTFISSRRAAARRPSPRRSPRASSRSTRAPPARI